MNERLTSDEFRKIRQRKQLSQSEIAIILGVSTVTVKAWEKGRRDIPRTINNFVRLSIINCPREKLKTLTYLLKPSSAE